MAGRSSTLRSERLARRARSTTSGVLLAGAAGPLLVLEGAMGPLRQVPWPWQAAAAVCCVLLLVAGSTVIGRARLGQVCATLGCLGALALAWPALRASPHLTLGTLVSLVLGLALLWRVGAPLLSVSLVQLRAVVEGQAQGAALSALALWALRVFAGGSPSTVEALALGWALTAAWLLGIEWSLRSFAEQGVRAALVGGIAAVACAGGLSHLLEPMEALGWVAMSAAVNGVLIGRVSHPTLSGSSWWEPLVSSPERVFVGTFVGLCALGTLLLALPQSASGAARLSFLDATFTATSAVCVTGLTVVETAGDFTGFGQAVVLLLIQVGGLGIMTFSTAALWALGRRLSLRHEGVMASLISTHDRSRLFATARHILTLTVVAEGVGAVVLTLAFLAHGDDFAMAAWRGLFTAVSAFCNAGFALQPDSLVPYQHSGVVLHTVAALIVLGSLSPLTVMALPGMLRRSASPVPAQVKLNLISAAFLLVLGGSMFLAVEWSASLSGLGPLDKFHNAWLHSVTLRTAGFNSVDLTHARPASIVWMLLWMFIGGSPGGTAGGVKTTTIAVLVLSVLQAFRGQSFLEIFGRRISPQTFTKAVVVLVVAASSGFFALLSLLLTQSMPAPVALFEVVSALGTVGLSLGGTARLDGIGKAIIILCMFVGRVGGLTLLMFLADRRSRQFLDRPEEDIDVG